MEFIDTPNPNAKKIIVEHSYEISIYLNEEETYSPEINYLLSHDGVKSIFTGPNFLTISKIIFAFSLKWNDLLGVK